MPDDQELTEAPDGQETIKVKKDLLVQQKIYDMILYAYPAKCRNLKNSVWPKT